MSGRVLVIGVGNPLRGDDGIGPAAVEALRGRVPQDTVLVVSDGEPARMLDLWRGADTVVVVEALRAHPARPGEVHTLTPVEAACHAVGTASTHAFGLGSASPWRRPWTSCLTGSSCTPWRWPTSHSARA